MKRLLKLLLLLLLTAFANPALMAQDCDDDESFVEVYIFAQAFISEIGFSITDAEGAIYATGNVEGGEFCIPAQACLTFHIYDLFGDGICCQYEDGYYEVWLNGELIITELGDYGSGARTPIDCLPGTVCLQGEVIDEPDQGPITNFVDDQWYNFAPAEEGNYVLTTCLADNQCEPAIWVYDQCIGLVYDDTNQSTIAWSLDGSPSNEQCSEGEFLQVELELNLSNDQEYYFRIGGIGGECSGEDIVWELNYLGPAMGCMEPTACNYDPVATQEDPENPCLFPGDPDCPAGPDLTVRQSNIQNSLIVAAIDNEDECLVEEGCVNGYGVREVLRFSTVIANIGELDYYIGQPPPSPQPDEEPMESTQWEWDPCHNHWHQEGYAEYILYDAGGNPTPIGSKVGFCVLDLGCTDGDAKFTCGNMGISAGCYDEYHASLECQWVDITGIDTGLYTLVVRVNWDQSPDALGRVETDYYNNWAQVCFRLFRDLDNEPYILISEECTPYEDCLGELYGSAVPDCTGECDGPILQGDFNEDGDLVFEDVSNYLLVLFDDIEANACNDLNSDGSVNIVDAALLSACVYYDDSTSIDDWCVFPYDFDNPNEEVWIGVDTVNVEEQYVDLYLYNPLSRITAFQFTIEGLEFSSAASIYSGPPGLLSNDENQLSWLTLNGFNIDKTEENIPIIRLFYDSITADSLVCVAEIEAIVNDAREQVVASIGECAQVLNPVIDVCAGILIGDVDENEILDANDISMYLQAAILDSVPPQDCLDLTGDVLLTLADALAISNCVSDVENCVFPVSDSASSDSVWLSIDTVNAALQYADLTIYNPNSNVAAFRFEVEGLAIESIEKIGPVLALPLIMEFDNSTVVSVLGEGISINSMSTANTFLRLHYSSVSEDSLVCIAPNPISYNAEVASLPTGRGDCAAVQIEMEVDTVGLGIEAQGLNFSLSPNPATNFVQLDLRDFPVNNVKLDLYNSAGSLVRSWVLKGGSYGELDVSGLQTGLYLYRFDGLKLPAGKIIIE